MLRVTLIPLNDSLNPRLGPFIIGPRGMRGEVVKFVNIAATRKFTDLPIMYNFE